MAQAATKTRKRRTATPVVESPKPAVDESLVGMSKAIERFGKHMQTAVTQPGEPIAKSSAFYCETLRRQDVRDMVHFLAAQNGIRASIDHGLQMQPSVTLCCPGGTAE